MTVVSAFLIIEHCAQNALFENWRPALLKTWAEHCQLSSIVRMTILNRWIEQNIFQLGQSTLQCTYKRVRCPNRRVSDVWRDLDLSAVRSVDARRRSSPDGVSGPRRPHPAVTPRRPAPGQPRLHAQPPTPAQVGDPTVPSTPPCCHVPRLCPRAAPTTRTSPNTSPGGWPYRAVHTVTPHRPAPGQPRLHAQPPTPAQVGDPTAPPAVTSHRPARGQPRLHAQPPTPAQVGDPTAPSTPPCCHAPPPCPRAAPSTHTTPNTSPGGWPHRALHTPLLSRPPALPQGSPVYTHNPQHQPGWVTPLRPPLSRPAALPQGSPVYTHNPQHQPRWVTPQRPPHPPAVTSPGSAPGQPRLHTQPPTPAQVGDPTAPSTPRCCHAPPPCPRAAPSTRTSPNTSPGRWPHCALHPPSLSRPTAPPVGSPDYTHKPQHQPGWVTPLRPPLSRPTALPQGSPVYTHNPQHQPRWATPLRPPHAPAVTPHRPAPGQPHLHTQPPTPARVGDWNSHPGGGGALNRWNSP